MESSSLLRFYRTPGLHPAQQLFIRRNFDEFVQVEGIGASIIDLETEYCYHIESDTELSENETGVLKWLLSETFEQELFAPTSFLHKESDAEHRYLIEIGPRLNFATPWSTNAVAICKACGLKGISRIERSRRIALHLNKPLPNLAKFLQRLHDRMTEYVYDKQPSTLRTDIKPEPWTTVPVLKEGKAALEKINKEMGLAFDDWDLEYYSNLFTSKFKRDPTTVECFDLSQSNSEHSRHWFFKGRMIIDGKEMPHTLFELVMQTQEGSAKNSVIAFRDNSSSIKGFNTVILMPSAPGTPSAFVEKEVTYNITFTAETHNFPTGVAPFPGAGTGTGGRIRDGHATGRASLVIGGTVGYCVGALNIPGYDLPWEADAKKWQYTTKVAPPLQIEIDASNGASDYGNKFGEPVIVGFTRSFGMVLPDGERREYLKPIMFSGGIGQMDDQHNEKGKPELGMLVVKLGGPAYRIGVGGGAASSMIQGVNTEELDFQAVQRGDPEMEQKVNRVIKACAELGPKNPIISIHDQGAGGNGNVLKELADPLGARFEVRDVLVGDESLSVLEIWGAEYQENDALLIRPGDDLTIFSDICKRERAPFSVVGKITGDGRVVLHDSTDDSTPLDLDLETVLGKMPSKTFHSDHYQLKTIPLALEEGVTVASALDRVLRLLSVGSKRFLTNKVDRSVTGLIAQQQCVGPLHIPLADCAVIAQGFHGLTGAVTAIGEQPIKGLIDPSAMARLAVGEMLTNIVWAKMTAMEDIKCSGNWMWAAKQPHEGAALYDAALAMRDIMLSLGIAIDGGKDSLSMATKIGDEIVKAPGTLVISGYCTVPDITKKVTPDLKAPGQSTLFHIDLSGSAEKRLGGSSLAHVFNQLGDVVPDVNDIPLLKRGWNVIQSLIEEGKVLSGHDISDGGLLVTLLEMAFTGNCGFDVAFSSSSSTSFLDRVLSPLFAEELGVVIEVEDSIKTDIVGAFEAAKVPCIELGKTTLAKKAIVRHAQSSEVVLDADVTKLRDVWEATSFQLERKQANIACVEQEEQSLSTRKGPKYQATFKTEPIIEGGLADKDRPRVAVLREEGTNGDRELGAAFHAAGFEVWDVNLSDLIQGNISLSSFRGIAFAGGFSYGDVMDSAKGWAGEILFNEGILKEFQEFYDRKDTFSLGVCNGCQLMALLGWVPYKPRVQGQPLARFITNVSERFESRFATLKITESPSIFLKGMEGSTLGIWVAHGEGRVHCPDPSVLEDVCKNNLAPLRYVNDDNMTTEQYPFNPNGSPLGIAGLCSLDGRHMALMPHPERCFLEWQWPYMPPSLRNSEPTKIKTAPWFQLFANARKWCEN